MPRSRRITTARLAAGGVVLLSLALGACSGEDAGDTAPASTSTTVDDTTQAPPTIYELQPLPVCAEVPGGGIGGPPPSDITGGTDPYAVRGVRQPAGPEATTTLVPKDPVAVEVERPPDPDRDSPARAQPADGGIEPAAFRAQVDCIPASWP